MDKWERAHRAKGLLNDSVLQDALAEMERRAIEEFVTATQWWWGDRRRRIAAEHLREVRAFRSRLQAIILEAPTERIRSIA